MLAGQHRRSREFWTCKFFDGGEENSTILLILGSWKWTHNFNLFKCKRAWFTPCSFHPSTFHWGLVIQKNIPSCESFHRSEFFRSVFGRDFKISIHKHRSWFEVLACFCCCCCFFCCVILMSIYSLFYCTCAWNISNKPHSSHLT